MQKIIFGITILSLISCSREDSNLISYKQTNAITQVTKASRAAIPQYYGQIKNIKRYYNPSLRRHYYGISSMPPGSNPNSLGWILESTLCRVTANQDNIQLWMDPKSFDTILTINPTEIAQLKAKKWVLLEYAGDGLTTSYSTTPVYRYFSSKQNDHFFTTDFSELQNGRDGYILEGIAFYLPNNIINPNN